MATNPFSRESTLRGLCLYLEAFYCTCISTYPFVLSWSLLEAMSIGCAIVASDTPPLYECIIQKDTGVLTSFFDPKKLSDEIVNLLENPELRKKLGANARQFACDHYDLSSVILPRQIKWVNSLLDD